MSKQFTKRLGADTVVADLPPLAALSNTQKLVRQSSSSRFLIEEHFLKQLLEPLLKTIFVDEQWYLSKYPDVRGSLGSGAVKSAGEHYARFGYFEHRMPYEIRVDEAWYLAHYVDVKATVSREDMASGQEHFDTFGFKEGRLPHSNFALRRK